jgi:hypothetical protein
MEAKMAKIYKVEDSIELLGDKLTQPPFGKINMWREPGCTHVLCYIDLGERAFEQTVTGVAIDGSGSMQPQFGFGPFGKNKVRDVAQVMCDYIAQKADKYDGTSLIYWATGDPGEIEPHGFLTRAKAQTYNFPAPKAYGRKTNLLPAMKFFTEGKHPQSGQPYKDEDFGLFIFITDGAFDDLDAVKTYSTKLAQEIENGSRKPIKLIIIGLGDQIDEQQMSELDDLETGTDQDLYFHRIAAEMSDLSEIFIELVNENMIIADNGVVRDAKGTEVLNFRDTKVPALFEFDLPAGATSFTLEVEGQKFTQVLP